MFEFFIGPFQFDFMTRALIVSVLVGITCPILGAYVITRGNAFLGDALSHSVVPGMVVAFMLGISPFFAAVPAGIVIAIIMGTVSRRTGLTEDTSIGIVFAGMFALGLVMLSKATSINVNIEDLLLGQVLGVTQTDVYISIGLTVLVVAGLYTFHRQLVYTTHDSVGASVAGVKTEFVEYVLLALLALVIVIGIQAAGIALVMAMLITPAATAYLIAKALRAGDGSRSSDRRGLGGNRPIPVLLCGPSLGPRYGACRDAVFRGVRRVQERTRSSGGSSGVSGVCRSLGSS